MRKKFICILLVLSLCGCNNKSIISNTNSDDSNISYINTMKRDILCLMMAYPKNIIAIEKDSNKVYLIMKSGRRIIYDDKIEKNNITKYNYPDLQDIMEQIYPINQITELLEQNNNPGRIREYNLLNEVYGDSRKTIESNLIRVSGIGQFNCQNDSAKNLKLAMSEIRNLAKNNTKINSFIYPLSGTYNYRRISRTNRLSPHAYGIAIDLRSDSRDYWQWASRKQGQSRLNQYSVEVVKTFEKYNFIWGGKWGHFDILHFEYRPEIILKARYFSENPQINKPWYDGITNINQTVKKYIDVIDDVL